MTALDGHIAYVVSNSNRLNTPEGPVLFAMQISGAGVSAAVIVDIPVGLQ